MEDKHLTIVFMGDSITEGQYVLHPKRWTKIVANNVRKHLTSVMDNEYLHFFNRGISGETTRQALERFPKDVQQLAPQLMTLQFGLNDCNCWVTDKGHPRVSEAAFKANLHEMINRARICGTRHIVLSTNQPTLRHNKLISGETLEERRKIYNAIIREVAHESGVTLCDMDYEFTRLSSDNLSELLLPEPDLLHLSKSGHELYANIIITYILSAIDTIIKEDFNA